MNTQLIRRMALGIREAANNVCCKGRDNWMQLYGIMQTAESIVEEIDKHDATEVKDG